MHRDSTVALSDHTDDELVFERLPGGGVAWLRPVEEPVRYTITDAGRAVLEEHEREAEARANAMALLFGVKADS